MKAASGDSVQILRDAGAPDAMSQTEPLVYVPASHKGACRSRHEVGFWNGTGGKLKDGGFSEWGALSWASLE